ncbi:MAG: bifunctional folylpolyglutamate synthase/dihydrofolate synthase [Crocinitomicaceae bacterium TMED114]|nr:MAG: bifunctional folylpolyglutamate synthase/dihydrofolate synthase [Crocinitomicaceae bacterium TMED114]
MNYAEVLDWLYAQLPMFQRTGPVRYRIDLEKTRALCAALGHPEAGLKVVHIAGTNGKGSVSHAVAKALQSRGLQVGLYTSPHLVDPRERIRIQGEWIPQAAFVSFVVDHMAIWEELQPSFFELMFTMALTAFRDAEVDIVVLETGMGGRLDSTNIFPAPRVTAITSIGLDHQQFLGPDLRSIAREKAGILKEGIPCVVGILPPEARSVVLEQSMRLGVEVYDGMPDPTEVEGPNWLARNRAVARCILSLIADGDPASDEAVLQAGPAAWGLRGRWHREGEHVLLDCAHNVEGLNATGEALARMGRPLRLVFGTVADKDVAEALQCLPPAVEHHWCAADVPRAMAVQTLSDLAVAAGRKGHAHSSVPEAVLSALEARQGDELVVVLGSVFTVGEALTALNA